MKRIGCTARPRSLPACAGDDRRSAPAFAWTDTRTRNRSKSISTGHFYCRSRRLKMQMCRPTISRSQTRHPQRRFSFSRLRILLRTLLRSGIAQHKRHLHTRPPPISRRSPHQQFQWRNQLPYRRLRPTPEPIASPPPEDKKGAPILVEEPGMSWWDAKVWDPWEGNVELGLNGTDGNSETFDVRSA